MKKVLAIVAIAALTACGGATTEVKTDSTTVVTDSTTQKDTSDYKAENKARLEELKDSTTTK
jgi:outer membrane biogenesis lipoprotein LolB